MASMIQTGIEARALLREHGLAQQGWRFEWDNARQRGGQCRYRDRAISMSKHLVPIWTEEQVRQTLLHEVAHALVGPGHGHGAVWMRKAQSIGFTRNTRTHSNETVPGRYAAICDTCNREVRRAHRFTAAMKQGRHFHQVCGKPVRWVDTAVPAR